jgi:hypothetical protein
LKELRTNVSQKNGTARHRRENVNAAPVCERNRSVPVCERNCTVSVGKRNRTAPECERECAAFGMKTWLSRIGMQTERRSSLENAIARHGHRPRRRKRDGYGRYTFLEPCFQRSSEMNVNGEKKDFSKLQIFTGHTEAPAWLPHGISVRFLVRNEIPECVVTVDERRIANVVGRKG